MTVAWYIALSLISRYLFMDPTNRDISGLHCNTFRLMPRDLTDDRSTLVQVMAWCRKATSHYLSQCWPTSMSPYDITRPQWVKWWYRILVSFFMAIIDQKNVCFDITACLSEQRSPGREHDRLPQYYGQDLSSDDRKPVSCENTHQRDCIYYHEGDGLKAGNF